MLTQSGAKIAYGERDEISLRKILAYFGLVKPPADIVILNLAPISQLESRHVEFLSAFRELRTVGLHSQFREADLTQLSSLIRLKNVSLEGREITDDGLVHVRDLQELALLDTFGTKITGTGLVHLTCTDTLTSLFLGEAATDDGLKLVPRFRNLESIYFQNSQITGAGISELAKLRRLTSLSFSGKLPHLRLEDLLVLSNLRGLDIKDDALADFNAIGRLRVKSLTLGGENFSDAILEHVREMPNLEWLYLWHTQATYEGLAGLRDVGSLKGLNLNGARFADDNIETLAELDGLIAIFFGAKTGVTEDGVSRLQKLLPSTRIQLWK
jgi:hypothetical protein